jgi:heat shock protein HtpX
VSTANLFEQQRQNRRRSAILVAVFILFFAWIGFGADGTLYLQSAGAEPGQYRHTFPFIGIGATILGLGMTWFAWRGGARQVLSAVGAWELVTPSTDQERQFANVVEEMAIASGLSRPRIWIIPDDDPNAFATGSDPKAAHIAVTKGLLDTLSRDELQGVVAHEMAHVRNLDVRLMTLLAALVGVIAIISDVTMRGLRFGGGSRSRAGGGGKKGGGAGGLAILLIVLWLITVILAPIISRMLALGVSRKREYLADATGAQFTRNPGALASALEKIEHADAPTRSIKHGTAHLCIADPLGRRLTSKEGFVADMLATHPPMARRIARLKQMAYQYEKTGELIEPAL